MSTPQVLGFNSLGEDLLPKKIKSSGEDSSPLCRKIVSLIGLNRKIGFTSLKDYWLV